MKHLKDKIYYSDLYDSITVSRCRMSEDAVLNQDMSKYEGEDKDKKHAQYVVHQLTLYYECAERYMRKPETIREWMERDRCRDEHEENAIAPRGVRCLKCGSGMSSTSKHLDIKDDSERVLFFYDCPNKCLPRRAFYEDNEEYITKPHLCPKCQHEVSSNDERNGEVVTITYSCANCGYKEIETLDLHTKEEKPDEHYEEDRKRFCFDKEKGDKAVEEYHRLMEMGRLAKEWEERDKNKDLYDAVAKIKKLPFGEVQKILAPVFEAAGYTNLQFQPPQMTKDVVVGFTAVDSKEGRDEYTSKKDLKNALQEALEGSNWRLMSEGIEYRLGFVSGRIRGLESEEDLLKLVQKAPKNET